MGPSALDSDLTPPNHGRISELRQVLAMRVNYLSPRASSSFDAPNIGVSMVG